MCTHNSTHKHTHTHTHPHTHPHTPTHTHTHTFPPPPPPHPHTHIFMLIHEYTRPYTHMSACVHKHLLCIDDIMYIHKCYYRACWDVQSMSISITIAHCSVFPIQLPECFYSDCFLHKTLNMAEKREKGTKAMLHILSEYVLYICEYLGRIQWNISITNL